MGHNHGLLGFLTMVGKDGSRTAWVGLQAHIRGFCYNPSGFVLFLVHGTSTRGVFFGFTGLYGGLLYSGLASKHMGKLEYWCHGETWKAKA